MFLLFIYPLLGSFLGAQEPRVAWRFSSDDRQEVILQVQNLKEGIEKYRVVVFDLITRKIVDEIEGFEPTQLSHIYSARWTPENKQGIQVPRLLKRGEQVEAVLKTELPFGQVSYKGEFFAINAELDYREKAFKWDLSRSSLIRAMVTFKSGMPLARPFNWRLAPSGRGFEDWNFKGTDGFDYHSHPNLVPYLQSLSVPVHWIVWDDIDWSELRGLDEFSHLPLPDREINFEVTPVGKDTRGAKALESTDEITYQHGLGLRVELDDSSKAYVAGRRFEILIYLNGEFLHEESQGVDPYVYALPESISSEGLQTLSVYLLEYGGSWGTRTFKIRFP